MIEAGTMDRARSVWHRLIERALPWYDPAREEDRNAATEALRQRSIRARIEVERVVDAYRLIDVDPPRRFRR